MTLPNTFQVVLPCDKPNGHTGRSRGDTGGGPSDSSDSESDRDHPGGGWGGGDRRKNRKFRRPRMKKIIKSSASICLNSNDKESDTRSDEDPQRRQQRAKLASIIPLNEMFTRVVDCRLYRLSELSTSYLSPVSKILSSNHKKLAVQMPAEKSNRKGPITVLKFLTYFRNACDQKNVSEMLNHILKYFHFFYLILCGLSQYIFLSMRCFTLTNVLNVSLYSQQFYLFFTTRPHGLR